MSKVTYGTWAKNNPEEKEKKVLEIKKQIAKKYPNSTMLIKNDVYCESVLRVKLRKDGIIY